MSKKQATGRWVALVLADYCSDGDSPLAPAQRVALAGTIRGLKLGAPGDLSFVPSEDGKGALLQNADGDIVGETASQPDVIASERTESIASLSESVVISRGMCWRFRGAIRSTCSLEVRFRDERLCGTDSTRVQNLIGVPVTYVLPKAHGMAYGHGYRFKARSGLSPSLSLGISDKQCASGFEVAAEGQW